MEDRKKVALNDELLDKVAGGVGDQITVIDRHIDGVCPSCGGPAFRVTEKGYQEKTWRECPVDGWISD